MPQITTEFNGLLATTHQLAQNQSTLSDVLHQLPTFLRYTKEITHPDRNLSSISVVYDTITCGLPTSMGGSDPNNPLTSCHGAG
jgi:hypothetical protein